MSPTAPPEAPQGETPPTIHSMPRHSEANAGLPRHSEATAVSHSSHPSHPQNSATAKHVPCRSEGQPGDPQHSQHPPGSAHATPGVDEAAPSVPPSPRPSVPLTTIGGLAELLGTDRGTIRNYILRLNFRVTTTRVGPRHKRVACLTTSQAAAVTSAYGADLAQGPELPDESDHVAEIPNPAHPDRNLGVVYLLQLEPDLDPHRYKVGFSHRPWQRLNDLLTVAPLAQCLAMWPARRCWERTAIEAISQTSTQIREEVYRADHIQNALSSGEKFFASLPVPHGRSYSSSYSYSSSPPHRNEPTSPRPRGAPPPLERPQACVEAARSAASEKPPDPATSPPKRLSVPPQTSRCGQAAGVPRRSEAKAGGAEPDTLPATAKPIATRRIAVASACSKTCGREAAPPASQTSRCGQAADGAKLDTLPATHPPVFTRAIDPPRGIQNSPRWGDTPWSPNLRHGPAEAGAEQRTATTPAHAPSTGGVTRNDGAPPSPHPISRSDTLPEPPRQASG